MSLPADWVDRIFERLALVYGHSFSRRWEGMDAHQVKQVWARELAGYERRPKALQYALQHLPQSEPPTAIAFRLLCVKCPDDDEALKLADQRPRADLPRLAAELRRLQSIRSQHAGKPRAWAERLRDREKAGEPLSDSQRQAWRNALRALDPDQGSAGGAFVPVDPSVLPPGGLRPPPQEQAYWDDYFRRQ